MVWEKDVALSEQVCFTLKPILYVSRLLGVFPAAIVRKGNKLYLRWSPLYILYSASLGIVIPIITYRGLILDIMRDQKISIKIKSTTDMYVAICDITVLILAVVCGIYSNVFGRSQIFKFIECCNKVDSVIPPNNTRSTRNKTIFMIIVVMTATFSITTVDLIMYFVISDESVSNSFICECYLGFYRYYILNRLEQLNKHLQTDNFRPKTAPAENSFATKLKAGHKRIGHIIDTIATNESPLPPNDVNVRNNHILELMKSYEKLCDAVDILSQLYGFTNAVVIIGILWHMIETPYLLINEIIGERKDPIYITVLSSWCFLHVGRLMLIAQPCYGCVYQAQTTNDLIAKLLFSQNTDPLLKAKLQDFSVMLLHRKFEFTASGLTKIDRSLMISVLGAVTTYLVILLQFAKSEKS